MIYENVKNYLQAGEEFNEKLKGSYAIANEFARMPKKVNVQSMKLFGLILSKLNFKKDNRNDNQLVEISCTIGEIIKACGLDPNDYTNYEYYKNLCIGLVQASWVEGILSDNVSYSGYAISDVIEDLNADKMSYTFTLSNKLLPYFQLLASNYTIVHLEQAKQFKSRFSYNLYLNLLSWTSEELVNYRIYTTKQLKEIFGLSEKAYTSKLGKFKRTDFEKKTIEIAVQEINEQTSMRLACEKIKKNNRVMGYKFEFLLEEDLEK